MDQDQNWQDQTWVTCLRLQVDLIGSVVISKWQVCQLDAIARKCLTVHMCKTPLVEGLSLWHTGLFHWQRIADLTRMALQVNRMHLLQALWSPSCERIYPGRLIGHHRRSLPIYHELLFSAVLETRVYPLLVRSLIQRVQFRLWFPLIP